MIESGAKVIAKLVLAAQTLGDSLDNETRTVECYGRVSRSRLLIDEFRLPRCLPRFSTQVQLSSRWPYALPIV